MRFRGSENKRRESFYVMNYRSIDIVHIICRDGVS